MAEGGAAQSRGAAIRETFAVALIAGEGVDLSGLSGLAGDKGFALLTRDDVVGTAPDEGDAVIPALQQEWEDAKAKAEDPELPMPHKLFGCLLELDLGEGAGEDVLTEVTDRFGHQLGFADGPTSSTVNNAGCVADADTSSVWALVCTLTLYVNDAAAAGTM